MTYDAVIQAKTATLHFDLDAKLVRVYLRTLRDPALCAAMPMSS